MKVALVLLTLLIVSACGSWDTSNRLSRGVDTVEQQRTR